MAGNASNWYKPTRGPLKGQTVYARVAGMNQTDRTILTTIAQARGTNLRVTMLEQLNRGYVTPQTAPAGAARSPREIAAAQAEAQAKAARAAAAQGTRGTPTPHAQPMDLDRANDLIRASLVGKNYNDRDSTVGYFGLNAIYTAQGFHAKPDVLTKKQIDAYVAKGERELYRGTSADASGNPDGHSEAFRSGAVHYAGNGIYGNGTYTGSLLETQAYVGGSTSRGRILRMTIKADANVGQYYTLNSQRINEYDAVQESPRYRRYDAAVRKLQDEFARVMKPKYRDPAKAAQQAAAGRALGARMQKIRVRQDREVPTAIYHDVGAYAAAKGYDAYEVRGTGGNGSVNFHVILNRGAVRVQAESIIP